jgi:hypothetical protein
VSERVATREVNMRRCACACLAFSVLLHGACTSGDRGAPLSEIASTTWLKGDTGDQMTAIERQLDDKVKLALELALERRPKRAASARPFLMEDLPAVVAAIDAKDAGRYRDALERLRTSCAKCQVAESVPFFAAQFPERRTSVIRPPE